ncbi:EAL domain-containing protein [Jeotgalibacillus terrae]|uniref:EAL domain-containing protein n=1 Tax=Jeotgalibacillus terrae TaxID=587735 RepID=A0ABW5ZD03_9BACL|nr:EAL domain-containing protein [Jeotgalibacillus terrae]MBM7580148.1 diguanylate cyclase (GGDEF)-like protein/PAS domain S-box-containing protein [Jeotgalibacillus terrae]
MGFFDRLKRDETAATAADLSFTVEEKHLNELGVFAKAALWAIDIQTGLVTSCTPSIEKICGYPAEMFLRDELKWEHLVPKEYHHLYLENQKQLKLGKPVQSQYQIKDRSDNLRWVNDRVIPELDEAGELVGIYGLVLDITEEKERELRDAYEAEHETLTGLPNQKRLNKDLKEKMAQGKPFTVFSLKLDRMTLVADVIGRQTGEEAVRKMAQLLEVLNQERAKIYHVRKNEFIYVYDRQLDDDEAVKLCRELIDGIQYPIIVDKLELYFTGFVGAAAFPEDGNTPGALIQNVHKALYYAIESGVNSYMVHSKDLSLDTYKRISLDRDLFKAVKEGQFELKFQPIVEADRNMVVGAEALIRWNHPEWGLLSPDEFLNLAEMNGLIADIDNWVLEEVCRNLDLWRRQKVPLVPISVNRSAKSFLQFDTLERMITPLRTYNVDPSLINFELTESSFVENSDRVAEVIAQLGEKGFRIALDDFGTGFSSLFHLKEFQVQTLKIDREFIGSLLDGPENMAITNAIIQMAQDLDLKVTAEGVEEPVALRWLQERGCDYIQGYIYSKPVSAENIRKIFAKRVLKPVYAGGQLVVENRRQYFRIKLPYKMTGAMTITQLAGRPLSIGNTPILIDDIGGGGLSFTGKMELPIRQDVMMKFSFEINGKLFEMTGQCRRKDELKNHLYSYGVEFLIKENDRDKLISALHDLQVHLKEHPYNPIYPYFKEEALEYFRG